MTQAKRAPRLFAAGVRLALPAALLAIGIAAFAYLSAEVEQEKSPPAEKQPIRTRVTELHIVDYPVVITTNGIVQAHNEVAISAQVAGQITRISPAFEVGSYFAANEVLVEIDDRDYRTAVAIAEAQLLGAKSALELATETHDRNKALYGRKGVSEAVLGQSFAAQAQAEALLDSAKAAVEQAKRDLERTKILAPFDGRVRQKLVGIGQSVGAGTPLGTVFSIEFAEVRLPIAASELQYLDLPELATDPSVDVELRDAVNQDSDVRWHASIVRTEGTLDENSLELFAIARIDDPFGRQSGATPLRVGQPVIGSIAGKVLDDVIALPRAAVRQLDQIYLVDRDDLTLIPKTIEEIWSDEQHVIIRDPLIEDGDWLSTTRIVYAPEGAKVELISDIVLTPTTAQVDTNTGDATN